MTDTPITAHREAVVEQLGSAWAEDMIDEAEYDFDPTDGADRYRRGRSVFKIEVCTMRIGVPVGVNLRVVADNAVEARVRARELLGRLSQVRTCATAQTSPARENHVVCTATLRTSARARRWWTRAQATTGERGPVLQACRGMMSAMVFIAQRSVTDLILTLLGTRERSAAQGIVQCGSQVRPTRTARVSPRPRGSRPRCW